MAEMGDLLTKARLLLRSDPTTATRLLGEAMGDLLGKARFLLRSDPATAARLLVEAVAALSHRLDAVENADIARRDLHGKPNGHLTSAEGPA